MDTERRAFARVDTFIHAQLRILDSSQAPALFSSHLEGGGALERVPLDKVKLPEAMVEFLGSMDRKLDTILSLLHQDTLEKDFPLELDVLQVSGAGCRVVPHGDLPLGTHVEIVLILNQYPLQLAGAVGKVVRDQNGNNEGGEADKTLAVEFTRIRERDLDAIVQFVFDQDRQRIREHRWEE